MNVVLTRFFWPYVVDSFFFNFSSILALIYQLHDLGEVFNLSCKIYFKVFQRYTLLNTYVPGT